MWSVTSTATGRFSATETASSSADLLELFDSLTARGDGYVEVRRADSDFPLITIGFRGSRAVVHAASDTDSMSLLRGDGSLLATESVDVPIMDDSAAFTGDFVSTVDRARVVLEQFMLTGDVGTLGEWWRL
jgi:hypothetical protein